MTTHLYLFAEVKNAWSYTSATPYVVMAWYQLKHRDTFTFTSKSGLLWVLCRMLQIWVCVETGS